MFFKNSLEIRRLRLALKEAMIILIATRLKPTQGMMVFLPSEYPMSTVWINGRMPADEWKETHRGEYERLGDDGVEVLVRERGRKNIHL